MAETETPTPPSPWVERFAGLVPTRGEVLDVACGSGRHARLFAARGHVVTAVDRDAEKIAALRGEKGIEAVCADLEDRQSWPMAGRRFAGVVVTNYLYRPQLITLVNAVLPGGVLIYETFAAGNETFGKPGNPDFLLKRGELLEAVKGKLSVVAYEDGEVDAPRPAVVQRICAINRRDGTATKLNV
jgi:SAM-dependent methyltransferase